eukprot:TRINITY_DN41779_c0_g1_i1.p1 TRINITY_DN41779_c0_g1~~TRINITY_DN41779_c0_g1_i1.p1  ORF type:complete len:134 (+),score=50.79 TRINITY_DN41779_c0_g1_i1:46-447(+)
MEFFVSFLCVCFFFFFKQKTAYEMLRSLVGSEMCIRDRGTQPDIDLRGVVNVTKMWVVRSGRPTHWLDVVFDIPTIHSPLHIPLLSHRRRRRRKERSALGCLLYTSDAADEEDSVDLGGRRIIKKKKKKIKKK